MKLIRIATNTKRFGLNGSMTIPEIIVKKRDRGIIINILFDSLLLIFSFLFTKVDIKRSKSPTDIIIMIFSIILKGNTLYK